jgi:serine/threonine protein kinase
MDASHVTVQNSKHFEEDEVKGITNNYSTCIGEGGFGKVYKGVLPDDYDLVAVKKCIRKELRAEFIEEVRIHSQMKHKNIVKLIGYCISESNLMLITEYISNGNLDDILHNSDISIPLDIRLGIAIGCAEALSYMHSMHLSSGNLIYHGDIKPANILLDDNFTAKVSDFGLSRLLSGGITRYTSMVVGSINYMDPICFHTGCLTPKSDVYSFGKVLLELIARKRASEGDVHLVGTFANAKGRELRQLFDSEIANKNNIEILQQMVKLANECLSLEISHRPEINDVAKRLRVLKRNARAIRHENTPPRPILESYCSWSKKDKQDKVQLKSPSFLKRNASNSKILLELRNVRNFTKEELNDVTENYSCLLGEGTQAKFYKGTLEDNTAVVVWKFLYADSEEAFINGGIILSQIVHKNIIRLLGCCLEAETLILIYEYANKGSLMDILGSQEDFSLDKRIGIAIKTAEALQYLHSSAAGIVGHGSVAASTILVDNNYSAKLTDFSGACKLIKESQITGSDSVIARDFLEEVLYNYPIRFMSVLLNMERDVYGFGSVLFALISRDNKYSLDELVLRFTEAYQTDDSGKAIFDKVITAEEEISVVEDRARLALKCTILNVDEMTMRPTMKEVAEQLHMIRRSWKGRTTEAATLVPEIEARAEPRLPNLMRHLYGYRQIRW